MKSIFYTVAAAATVLGCLPFTASATDAGKQVAAQFNATGSSKPTEFTPVTYKVAGKKGGYFGNFEPIGSNENNWQVLNIPVRIGAGKVSAPGGDKVIATCIPEVTFHVYVRLEATMVDKSGKTISDKRKSCITLDKEITYVNIPLRKANGNTPIGAVSVDSYADMQVAVFLSPSDVTRIMEDETNPANSAGGKSQPRVKVAAVAMEATCKGVSCWRTAKNEKSDYLVVDSSVCSSLPDKWWKKNSGSTKGAALCSISETPFAADYYPYYCATKPMYGPGVPSSSPSAAETTPMEDTTPDASDDGGATGGDTAADDSADDSSSGSHRSGRRNKKDKKRGK